ncbi:hypothetical protein F5Y09DRAFT_343407 [Xylaria sp. FL1042]|nr:hypothetical protein F5Y09DRAFT_343407 [Xylaria sp. FL1042]
MNSRQLLSHILQLVGANDTEVAQENRILQLRGLEILGLSGGAYTIFYTCILQEDCYDNAGRTLTLSSGRASVNGTMRSLITERLPKSDNHEPTVWLSPLWSNPLREFSVLADGSYIEPHYAPSAYSFDMYATLTEHEILIHTSVTSDSLTSYRASLSRAVHNLLTVVRVPRACHHSARKPYQVRMSHGEEKEALVPEISPFTIASPHQKTVLFLAIKGKRFEQLIQVSRAGESGEYALQLRACLECTLTAFPPRVTLFWVIIMAG